MKVARFVLGTLIIGSILLAALVAGRGAQQPAQAAAVWIQVKPSSVMAGYQVTITASCQDNTNPATVKSSVFGTVTVTPYNGILTAVVTVPATVKEGGYDVTLTCKTGSSAITTLWIIETPTTTEPLPVTGPDTGGGFLASAQGGSGPLLLGSAGLLAIGLALGIGVVVVGARRRARRHKVWWRRA
jgi:hypothetical protein